jgi:hypothetical protein
MDGNYWTRQREAAGLPFIRTGAPHENYWKRQPSIQARLRQAALQARIRHMLAARLS